jgi:hypothetical protein
MCLESVFLLKKELDVIISSRLKILLHSFLFVLFGILFSYQLMNIPFHTINVFNWLWLIPVLVLVPLNWYLEFQKWRKQLTFLNLPKTHSIQSFAAGMVSEFIIPGIPTNFIGRILFFDSTVRLALAGWTQITNAIQFLVTVLCGVVAILVLGKGSLVTLGFLLGVFGVILVTWMIPAVRITVRKRFPALLLGEIKPRKIVVYLLQIGILSIFRMIVFSLQFALLLNIFGIPISFELVWWIWLSYLSVTLTPSLFLGKLFVRETITVAIFQLGNYDSAPVLLASFSIWFINGLIPTIFAWILTMNKK